MEYRVVLQGRTLRGAAVEKVKGEFVRVTGLPAHVAVDYFDGMPHAIKRNVAKADAERIAATLRAIGAAASVERESNDVEEGDGGEIHLVSNPLMSGPPTVIPGMAGAAMATTVVRRPRWLRELRERWPVVVGVLVLVVGATQLAPVIDEFVQTVNPKAPAVAVVPKAARPAEPPPAPIEFDASLATGPWRCTDQRTGVANYWTYQEDGKLLSHGDTFKDGALVSSGGAATPGAWRIEGGNLELRGADGTLDTFGVQVLNLGNLRYGDARRRIEIDCRRP